VPLVPRSPPALERTSAPASLDHPEPDLRRLAARNTPEPAPLADRLRVERHPAVQEAIVTALGAIGDNAAVAVLVECLRSEDPRVRNLAVSELARNADVVGARIPGLLSDPDSDVRILTAGLLGSLAHPAAEEWLCGVLTSDLDVNVCAAAVESLAMMGTPACRAALSRLPGRFPEHRFVRFAVDLALRQVGT
jgi:HEAT repeat protein